MRSSLKKTMIERDCTDLSLVRQCQLLGISRSLLYRPAADDKYDDLELMRLIDQQFMKTPFYGTRRFAVWLRVQGYQVNRKRVQRLMRLMG